MIRTKNLYVRNNKLYISSYTEYGRVRIATKLEDTPKNRAYVSENFENLIYKYLRGEKKQGSLKIIDLANELIESLTHIKQSSKDSYKTMINQIQKTLGNKDIRFFSAHNVGEFLQAKPKKYEHFFNRLISLANQKDSNLNLKPIKIKRIKTQSAKEDIQPFSLSEIKTILDFLLISSKKEHKELLTYLYIAFFTGARTGEILALQWEDIDLSNAKIAITKHLNDKGIITAPKTKSSIRYIDILKPLKEYLAKLPKDTELISLKRSVIRDEFYNVLKFLGIKRRVLYNTRHSFASIMLSHNEEPLWVAAMLGHKNLNITYASYAKFIPQQSRARAVFLDNILGGSI